MKWARTAVTATVAMGAAAGLYVALGREDDPDQAPSSAAVVPSAAPTAVTEVKAPEVKVLESVEEPLPWVGTWAVAVQPRGRAFARQTLRQIVHTSIGGTSARCGCPTRTGLAPSR